jgi:hypothetical protein
VCSSDSYRGSGWDENAEASSKPCSLQVVAFPTQCSRWPSNHPSLPLPNISSRTAVAAAIMTNGS